MHWCIAYYPTLHATDLSFFPCRNEKKVNDSPTLTNYTAAAESTFCVLLFFAQFFFVWESQKWVCCSRFLRQQHPCQQIQFVWVDVFHYLFFVPFSMPTAGAHMVGISRNRKQSTSLQSNMKVDIKWVTVLFLVWYVKMISTRCLISFLPRDN